MKSNKNIIASKKLKRLLFGFAFLILFVIETYTFYLDKERFDAETHSEVSSLVRAVIDDLQFTTFIAREIANFIETTGAMDQDTLEKLSRNVLNNDEIFFQPSSVQLAPNGIVTYEVPWTGGPHIGHNLFVDPERRVEASEALEANKTIWAGPLKLLQGGTALIARHPLKSPSGQLDGLATVLIDWGQVANEFKTIENKKQVTLQLYLQGKSGTKMIYPELNDAEIVSEQKQHTDFGGAQLYIKTEQNYTPSNLQIILATLIIFLTIAGVYALTKSNDNRELEQARATAETFLAGNVNPYVIQDEDWNYIHASEPFLKLIGADSIEDLPSSPEYFPELSPEDIAQYREEWSLVPLGDILEHPSILRLKTLSGDIRKVKRRARKITAPSGKGYYTLVAYEDITELEQQRRAAEELLNAGTSAYTVLDDTFKMMRASEEALKLFGAHSVDDLNNFTELFEYPDEQRQYVYSKLSELPTGDVLDYGAPFILNGLDGTQRTIKASSRWFNNPIGKGRLLWTSLDDVTDLVAARSFNEALLDKSPAIILTENAEFKIQSCSEAWVRRMGYSRKETVGREFVDFFVPEHRDVVRRARAKFKTGELFDHDFAADLLDKHGDVLHIRMNARVDAGGGQWRLILTVTDVTELEQQRRYTDTLLNRNSSIMLTQDADWKVLSCSQAWVDQLGYSRDETVGRDLVEFMHPEDAEVSRTYRETKLRRPQGESVIKNTLRFMTKSGEERIIELQSVVEDIDGYWRNILTLVDITEIMQTQDRLAYMVEHDELTGLLSRRGMQQRFSDKNRVEDKALYMLDIDHFKSVNDSFGHEAGDALLRTLGQTMRKFSAEDGDAIRLGGEEFAIIRPWYGWEDATHFGETLRQALEETKVTWNGRDIHRTASIGFAPLHMTDQLTDVLHLADLVAREAKSEGRNQVLGATEPMVENLRKRGVFIRADEIQAALENGEMHYEVQPIWNMEYHAIEGFEALIRWDKPDGTRVMPSLFIDLFYEVVREQRYLDLKTQMRRDCLAKLSAFPTQYVSFNFTLEQLGYDGAAQDIIAELKAIKDHAERKIVIEVSERAISARVDTALLRKEMTALQDAGYKIALDDFGVESSNLNRLQEFPISIVKIDKAIISNLSTSEIQRATLRGLSITLKTLGTKIIVEGVETTRQADILFIAGLYSHQGYLHARPMPPQEVEQNLDNIGKTTIASELRQQKQKKTRETIRPSSRPR